MGWHKTAATQGGVNADQDKLRSHDGQNGVWNPLENPDPMPLMIQNLAKYLEHAAKPVVAERCYDISSTVIEQVAVLLNTQTQTL